MIYGLLTPEVPLGPFEGSPITVWSTQGKQAKLHATSSCSYLRSARATEREVQLNASMVARMCPQCGAYSSWARPGTGLAVFLNTLTGLGLLYELDSFRDADEDASSNEKVRQAAALLHRPAPDAPADTAAQEAAEDDEDDMWEELQEARRVREAVFGEWRGALASMHRAHQQLELFPWLSSWAEAALQLKADRLRTLQAQARLLVTEDALLAAAVAAALQEPDVPADDPAFAPLGAPAEVKKQLLSLWRRWQGTVEDSWDPPREQAYLVHHLADGMGSRRKGRDQMLEHARAVLAEWETRAQSAAGGQYDERILVACLPHDAATERNSRRSLLDRLEEWELGVLAVYTVDTVWQPQSVITVRVPEPVAARLLTQQHGLSYSEPEAAGTEPAPETAAERSSVVELSFGPGVFDDTPVRSRRPVTREHLRALRAAMRDAEQLYVVFSVDAGLEVVALSVLEQRCAAGWQGVIIAGASDLPGVLFDSRHPAPDQDAPETEEIWPEGIYDPHHEAFGARLGVAEGERLLVQLCAGRRDVGHALRSLALARGIADLRQLKTAGYDDRGLARRPFASEVWHGLLAMDQLDLHPFEPDSDAGWRRGTGLPLGVLAPVQVYTSDAASQYQGRAHSPGCAHRRPEHGVGHDDDLVTLEELLGCKDFDPCSKCGGYAIRRLNQEQVAYYRAAHRLHDLAQRVHAVARKGGADGSELVAALEEFAGLDRDRAEAWFPEWGQARQWRQVVDRLRRELPGPGSV
ncbi:hypothetical protein [Streptomyces sp. PSKA30]|uniref:hypothetical protein n=1 Tax=Streptomyces sp. PSKA30 TaxID=2874597 RepID=UPI001CD1514E|nr:hypothetical protein [Streptomyces sp. PSKA30]MBZ9645022.1 hypothetical protein [Streptomyces sp. PSKA30]